MSAPMDTCLLRIDTIHTTSVHCFRTAHRWEAEGLQYGSISIHGFPTTDRLSIPFALIWWKEIFERVMFSPRFAG
jgi:hypothetical protein